MSTSNVDDGKLVAQINALHEFCAALHREVLELKRGISAEAVRKEARAVCDAKFAEIHKLRDDAVKVLGALPDAVRQHIDQRVAH